MPKTRIPIKELELISMTTTKDPKYVKYDKEAVSGWTESPAVLYAESAASGFEIVDHEYRDAAEEWLEENCTARYSIQPIYSNRKRSFNHYGHRESGKAHRKKATNYDKKTYKTRRGKVANDQDFVSVMVKYHFELESDCLAFTVFLTNTKVSSAWTGPSIFLEPTTVGEIKDRTTFKVQSPNPWE